jgi:hypothetical protein
VTYKKTRKGEKDPTCPDENVALGAPEALVVPWLDGEPITEDGIPRECWTTFVTAATNRIVATRDPVLLARGALALSTTPQRATDAQMLFEALAERVLKGGRVSLPASVDRAGRAIVLAAVLVGGTELAPPVRARLGAELAVQRDVRGSFGSPEATRAAVQGLLALANGRSPGLGATAPRFSIRLGDAPATTHVSTPTRFVQPVPEASAAAEVRALDGPVVARLERTFLRPYTVPAAPSASPISIVTRWPEPTRDEVGVLRVELHQTTPMPSAYALTAHARIPLPPGASLARQIEGVRQVQGSLRISQRFSKRLTLSLPIRFGLAGSYTLPEATVTCPESPATIGRAPARPLVVKERPQAAAPGASP